MYICERCEKKCKMLYCIEADVYTDRGFMMTVCEDCRSVWENLWGWYVRNIK